MGELIIESKNLNLKLRVFGDLLMFLLLFPIAAIVFLIFGMTLLGVVILFVAVAYLFLLFVDLKHSRTKIKVYEHGVVGDGIMQNSSAIHNFRLTYGEIQYVDTMKRGAVVIYTQFATYGCYASNYYVVSRRIKDMLNYYHQAYRMMGNQSVPTSSEQRF